MQNRKNRLWSSSRRDDYWRDKRAKEEEARARRDGDATAADLDHRLEALSAAEMQILRKLVAKDDPTVIAAYEDKVHQRLLEVGLLQIPPGVGTLFMNEMETRYRVPVAVWRGLMERRAQILDTAADGGTAE